jgi:archaeosortase A (PGF-CTERM-specific)
MIKSISKEDPKIASLFIIIPIIFLIIGHIFFQYELSDTTIMFLQVPVALALILLGFGFFIKKNHLGNKLKIAGWIVFAFYWSTQPSTLYFSEDGDIFNAVLCGIGVFVLSYIAYHEWLSIERKKDLSCLNWIAGAACVAGIIYFGTERIPFIYMWLRETVAAHSGWFLQLVTGENVVVNGVNILYKKSWLILIFACTGVQAMVIFVGMILPLPKVNIKRKIFGLIITVVPVYILNFMRMAMVSFLVGNGITDFSTAHNYIAKAGSLVVLIILLLFVVKIIPEIMDEIFCLTDLHKRNGPIEKVIKKYIRRSK